MAILGSAAVAFGVVFVAELGDKTQLLALGFGARHSLRQVAFGLFLGYGAAGIVAVAVGGVLGVALPERPIEIVGGVVFLGFAALTLRNGGEDHPEEEAPPPNPSRRRLTRASVTASIGLSILLAEMGDKTQIATATLASRSSPLGTWIGATLGATVSGMVGATAGTLLDGRISAVALRRISGLLFALFGVVLLSGGL